MHKLRLYNLFILVIILGVAAITTPATAQEQKIGFVNTDFILSKIPAYQGIQQDLRNISSEWKKELDNMQREIEELKEDLEAKEILFTDEMRAQRQQEIETLVQQREQYLEQKFGSGGEYFQKQQELLEPIQRRVFQAIEAVSRRQGFDFIFDRAQNSTMLVGSEQWNLNEQVLQELDITLNETSN